MSATRRSGTPSPRGGCNGFLVFVLALFGLIGAADCLLAASTSAVAVPRMSHRLGHSGLQHPQYHRKRQPSASLRLDMTVGGAAVLAAEPPAATETSGAAGKFSLGRPFSGLSADLRRRIPLYKSDWKDGMNKKSIPAVLFLYFTCLAPAVAFGGLTYSITGGTIGVIDFLLSTGIGGIAYALFAGQPMAFLGPTGLTLAFITSLYRFTAANGLPFLPLYSWTGLWTAGILALCSIFNGSKYIQFCTRYTDDCFNALLALNFLYEAFANLLKNFTRAGADPASALAAMNIALFTWFSTKKVVKVKKTGLFNESVRSLISDFGPTLVILAMSAVANTPVFGGMKIDFLRVPASFAIKDRTWIPDLFSVSPQLRMACLLPALLLSMLFYLDQNITVRTTEGTLAKKQGRKGGNSGAYHQDMMVLAAVTAVLSFLGLPWVCAATVQSLNHVRACTSKSIAPPGADAGISVQGALAGVRDEKVDIMENRVTGLATHSAILASLLCLPVLRLIPLPVISGVFLYLGRKIMGGNDLFERLGQSVVQRQYLPADSVWRTTSTPAVLKFVGSQVGMLALIWLLKSNEKYSIFFPSCIAVLAAIRSKMLPKLLSPEELAVLDSDM